MDIKEVSKKKKFRDLQDMASYMASKGYKWSSLEKNYIQETLENQAFPDNEINNIDEVKNKMNQEDEIACKCGCLEKYGDILRMLEGNKEKLQRLLDDKEVVNQVPRYLISGVMTSKTFNMSQPLKELIIEFSEEMNIQQKVIFEVAMIEFLKKYGYKQNIKSRFNI